MRPLMRGSLALLLGATSGLALVFGCSDSPTQPETDYIHSRGTPKFVNEFAVGMSAVCIAADESGHLLISNPFQHQITQFTSVGDTANSWIAMSKTGSELFPLYLEYWGGKVFIIAGFGPSRIVVFDSRHTPLKEWTELHNRPGAYPGGVDQLAIDRRGNVYTLQFENGTVVRYAPDGTFEREWVIREPDSVVATSASGIAVGPNDIVYISDTLRDRVLMFTLTGEFVGEIRGEGFDRSLRLPNGLAIDDRGILYIVDRLHYRVQMRTLDGQYISEFRAGDSAASPLLIAIHGNDVYVMLEHQIVQHFSPKVIRSGRRT